MHDWNAIRRDHGSLVFGVAYRILKNHDQALDCVQDVFLEAFSRTTNHSIENWPGLLRWIAVKRSLDRSRRERGIAKRVQSDGDAMQTLTHETNPCEELEFHELIDRVRCEVARLPEKQGEAFWLLCVEQLTVAEVAEHLATDTNTVGVLVYRARLRMRELLADVNPVCIEK